MTHPSTPLETICALYNLTPAQLQPMPGGHFSEVYEFDDHGATYVLRITPPNADIDLAAMQSIHEWLAFLAVQGRAGAPSFALPRRTLDRSCAGRRSNLPGGGGRKSSRYFSRRHGARGLER